jgi:hypothetical protein
VLLVLILHLEVGPQDVLKLLHILLGGTISRKGPLILLDGHKFIQLFLSFSLIDSLLVWIDWQNRFHFDLGSGIREKLSLSLILLVGREGSSI